VPPHEREWRHPSELPAPPHEPPTPGGRLLIVITAAVGLALVGVMAIRMTPGQSAHRDALVTVSTSSAFTGVSSNTFGDLVGAASNGGRRFTDLFGRTLTSLLSSADRNQASASTISLSGPTPGGDDVELAMVTPIGTDGLGVTTAAAIDGRSGTIEAMLPSGAIVTAELVTADDGVAVVELSDADAEPTTPRAEAPADDWTVVAFGHEFSVSDDGGDLQTLAVPEAAPIFDASGALIGLCTIGPDGVEMLPVSSLPNIATPRPVPDSTERTESNASTAPTEPPTSTEPVESTVPTAGTVPVEQPPTSAATLPASTDLATTDGSAVSSSEAADDSEPATTLRR
jgi:hypothetical protein